MKIEKRNLLQLAGPLVVTLCQLFAVQPVLAGTFTATLAATSLSLPFSNWTTLGSASEISDGHFQFTDPQVTNYPQRFYRVRSP